MLVLAVESATEVAGVALADEEGVIASVTIDRGRRHAETIVPAIQDLLRLSRLALSDVDAIAVDVGPGLFTGLRVGVATAKAMSFALGVPIVQSTSLWVLANAAFLASPPLGSELAAVVDARRGEVFWSHFRVEADGPVAICEEQVSSPDVLRSRVLGAGAEAGGEPPPDILLCGDGAVRYQKVFEGVSVAGQLLAPPVGVLGVLGVKAALSGLVVRPELLLPRYLREADAKINWEMRKQTGLS